MTFSYVSNRTQRTKINVSFGERSNIVHGVTRGSILGLLPFSIDLIDYFTNVKKVMLLVTLTILSHTLANSTLKQRFQSDNFL